MDIQLIEQLGDQLYDALLACKPITPFTDRYSDISIDDAYNIQQRMIERRLNAGEKITGKKIGATSAAVQNMLGVYQPDFGYLLDGMLVEEGDIIPVDKMIAPRAEGEIAFILKRDLMGPGLTRAEVLRATDCVMACFEIVDSRIQDWRVKIQDTVADNASCGVYALGSILGDPRKLDLGLCGMVLEKNGQIVATGAGAAALGHPANAIAWLGNTLGRRGIALKAGEVILSGSLAPLIPVVKGDHLRCTIAGMGHCNIRFG